jgi:hypothetical protein
MALPVGASVRGGVGRASLNSAVIAGFDWLSRQPLADMRRVEQLIAILVRKHPAPPYPAVLCFELHGGS